MFFKKKIQRLVYDLYHKSIHTKDISIYVGITEEDVDSIIDYHNNIHY